MPDHTPDAARPVEGTHQRSRLLILGANGPTGRQTVRQALDRGYRVEALTRPPEDFPITHERLRVRAGDATNPEVIDAAVAAVDAVICTIGASFTLQPVQVYSATTRLVVMAMKRHGRRRLIVVTSEGVDPLHQRDGLANKLSFTLMRRIFGRTVYDDMVTMEALVWGTDLDWTIVRPPGLTDEPGRGYAVAETSIEGGFLAREDLGAMLLDQLTDDRFVQKIAAVTTPGLTVGAVQMFRREILKR